MNCPLCGKELSPNNYEVPKTIKTINFPLTAYRNLYYCRDCKIGLDPLHNLFCIFEGHKITLHLTEEIVRLSQKLNCFQETQQELQHQLGFKISESVITEITEKVGNKLYQKEFSQADTIMEDFEKYIPEIEEEDKKDCTLYIQCDGSMLSIKNKQGTSWKEIKLGMLFKDNKIMEKKDGKNAITEKEYVSCLGSADSFKKMLFKTAVENGYGKTKEVVFLGDGAPWIWNIAEDLFPDAVPILDYYHLQENIYDYAEYLYPDREDQKENWAQKAIQQIENGNIDDLINKLPDKEKLEDSSQKKEQDLPNLKQYLINNKDKINYPEYRQQGYFIGSGAIESAHGKVLQQRLKQPGMHWESSNCQGVATLRTKYCSDQWHQVKNIIYDNAA